MNWRRKKVVYKSENKGNSWEDSVTISFDWGEYRHTVTFVHEGWERPGELEIRAQEARER